MTHYRCRDRITTMDVLIIAALAVAVMVALATCGRASDCPRMAVDASGSPYYIEYTNPIGYSVIENTSGLLLYDGDWAERVALEYETIVVLKHSLEFLELQRGQNKILSEMFDINLGKDKKRDKSNERVVRINRELSKRIKDLIVRLKGDKQ